MEISKELLSEVLGYKDDDYEILAGEKPIYIKGNRLHYEYQDPYCSFETYITIKNSINIYELAFKCKEWLYYQIKERINSYYAPVICGQYNIDIKSGHSPQVSVQYNNILNKDIKGDYYCRVSESDNSGQYRTFIAETEVKAIIKACEWALNEKQLQH